MPGDLIDVLVPIPSVERFTYKLPEKYQKKRLERGNTLMFTEFSIQDLIDKNFSENLWTKCYIKIKELILNQNTQNLKGKLNLTLQRFIRLLR